MVQINTEKMKLKTFKDLEFKPHPSGRGEQAKTNLNGCLICVNKGEDFECSFDTFELYSDRLKPFSKVKGYATVTQITTHMVYVQKHPKK